MVLFFPSFVPGHSQIDKDYKCNKAYTGILSLKNKGSDTCKQPDECGNKIQDEVLLGVHGDSPCIYSYVL